MPRAVFRLIAIVVPPSTGTSFLASAWSSSRSQLAAHADFVFEREGSTNILVSGGEGRTAARRNVLVTTDNRTAHRRWAAADQQDEPESRFENEGHFFYKKLLFFITCREAVRLSCQCGRLLAQGSVVQL